MKNIALIALMACVCTASFAAEPQSTLKKIRASKTLTLGYSESAVPFSFVGNDNRPQGTPLICASVSPKGYNSSCNSATSISSGVKVDVNTRIPAVMKGDVDIECGSTTHTLSRQEKVDFSRRHNSVDGGSYISKARAKLGSIKDLAGKRVSVIPGTTTEKIL